MVISRGKDGWCLRRWTLMLSMVALLFIHKIGANDYCEIISWRKEGLPVNTHSIQKHSSMNYFRHSTGQVVSPLLPLHLFTVPSLGPGRTNVNQTVLEMLLSQYWCDHFRSWFCWFRTNGGCKRGIERHARRRRPSRRNLAGICKQTRSKRSFERTTNQWCTWPARSSE